MTVNAAPSRPIVYTTGASEKRRWLSLRVDPMKKSAGASARSGSTVCAETITLRIRWFGLVFGFVLVNVLRDENRLVLNAILGLGLGYAILDTLWSLRGLVFLRRWPLAISLLEAVFVGLLCANDHGLQSPFLFYYLLSLLANIAIATSGAQARRSFPDERDGYVLS